MSDNTVRITFVNNYPMADVNCSRFPSFHVTKGCKRPGLAAEILHLLASYLNLTIEARVAPYHSDFSFMLDSIYRNETDLYASFFTNTSVRAENFDFSDPLYETQMKIAVKRTDRSLKDILSFFNVYQWDAWISMFLVFILFTSFGLLVRYAECQLKLRKKFNVSEVLWKMVRFQLVQSEKIDYKLVAGRSSLLVFSLFQVCIILELFQGFILSSVVKKTQPTPFTTNDNFPQLIKDGKLSVVAFSVDWFYQEIETNYASPYYELREALTLNNYTFVETHDDVLRMLEKGNGAVVFIGTDYPITFKAKAFCNIAFVESNIPPAIQRLMFRKGSPFVPLFNKAIWANKFKIEMIKKKYLDHQPPSRCAVDKDGPVALTLTPYIGLLLLFFGGLLIAFFVFGGELLRWELFDSLKRGNDVETNDILALKTTLAPMDIEQNVPPAGEGKLVLVKFLSAEMYATLVETNGLPQNARFYAFVSDKI